MSRDLNTVTVRLHHGAANVRVPEHHSRTTFNLPVTSLSSIRTTYRWLRKVGTPAYAARMAIVCTLIDGRSAA